MKRSGTTIREYFELELSVFNDIDLASSHWVLRGCPSDRREWSSM